MKKNKQVSLGKGRASALPFFCLNYPGYSTRTSSLQHSFYLGSQKKYESQTFLFLIDTCDSYLPTPYPRPQPVEAAAVPVGKQNSQRIAMLLNILELRFSASLSIAFCVAKSY